MAKKLFLFGFMGCGKTSVAVKISKNTGASVLDTDSEIERVEGASVSQIFKTHGQRHFRDLESKLCQILPHYTETIVSTGGGFLIPKENADIAKGIGPIVFLDTSFDTILSRLRNDNSRPLAENKDDMAELFKERQPIYKALATHTVSTDNKSINALATEIWDIYDTY